MTAPAYIVVLSPHAFLYVVPGTNKSKYVRTSAEATRFQNWAVAAWWVRRLNDGAQVEKV
jgi:hypothetical protein